MLRRRFSGTLILLCVLGGIAHYSEQRLPTAAAGEAPAYIFSSFRCNGEDGLHLAYSRDGIRWTDLGRQFLAPKVGVSKLMRDPCIITGPDGKFHMVWTPGWEEKGIGYASSPDLIHWSDQQYVEVMAHEPTTLNTWAPEITYDDRRREYVIYWASTIPGRFPGDHDHPKGWNHRIYYTTTRDFKTFRPTRLMFDPGYSAIDSTIVKRGPSDYVMVFKDERSAVKKLRVAFSRAVTGPYQEISAPFTEFHTEGPTILRQGPDWLVFFDKYTQGQYGAAKSRDLKVWSDISGQISVPKGQRHGSVLEVSPAVLDKLQKSAAQVRRQTFHPAPRLAGS